MSKNYIKVLFGNLFTLEGEISEDKITYTETPRLYLDMEAAGIVKLFETEEEAQNFKPGVDYWPSKKLFDESVPSLNNSNIAATYDFARSRPVVTAGVPANLLGLPVKAVAAPTPAAPPAPAKTPAKEEAPVPAKAPAAKAEPKPAVPEEAKA